MIRAFSLTLVSAATLCAATPTFADPAAPNAVTRSEAVEIGDLNTKTPLGADAAIRRVENTAQEICLDEGQRRPIEQAAAEQNCSTESTNMAIANSNNAALQQRHFGYAPQVVVDEYGNPVVKQ